MHTSAERALGAPLEVHAEGADFQLRHAGAPADAAGAGIGRTFVGWDEDGVVTCFAICGTPDVTARSATTRGCDASVRGAHLEGGGAPPPPGLVLGAVTWGVHHPATAVGWGAVLVFALAVVAVVFRRRPRSRI